MSSGQKMDKEVMRKSNMRLILSALMAAGEASKAQLAEETGMSVVSVGRIAEELTALGLIRETRRESDGSTALGRPPVVLSLRSEQLLCCGACLDWRELRLGLVDPYGRLQQGQAIPYPAGEDFTPQRVIPWVAGQLQDYLDGVSGGRVLNTVGLAVPGIVDVTRGKIQFSANFHWKDVPAADLLGAQLPGLRFVLENDVKSAAVAEHRFGVQAGEQNIVLLSIGTGIGAAVILNGVLYRGRDNKAGEIGHIALNPAGKLCECGRVGCLQTNLARAAILTEARSVYPGVTMEGIVARYSAGDAFAVALLERVADYIGMAVNLLANTYSPDAMLLGGSLFRESPPLCALVQARCGALLDSALNNSFSLRFERFGQDGAIIGGGVLAFHQILEELLAQEREGAPCV